MGTPQPPVMLSLRRSRKKDDDDADGCSEGATVRVSWAVQSSRHEDSMDEKPIREEFETGLKKIRQEIKSRLVLHGLYGTVTDVDTGPTNEAEAGSIIELTVKGKTVARSFDHQQIEGCRLRVGGVVLQAIISMVDEVSA
jgi:hypothetical protein